MDCHASKLHHSQEGLPWSTKLQSAVLFHDCPRPLGATVVLEGPIPSELQLLKPVLLEHIFGAYWNRLEVAFLVAEAAAVSSSLGRSLEAFSSVFRKAFDGAASARKAAAAELGRSLWTPSPYVSLCTSSHDIGSGAVVGTAAGPTPRRLESIDEHELDEGGV